MSILRVRTYPDPVLLKKTDHVTKITDADALLIRDMIDTMHAEQGVGLSANQVGVAKMIFVMSPDGEKGKELAYINPEILKGSGSVTDSEGCLSVPGCFQRIKRHKKITFRAETISGQAITVNAEGFCARIIQHEVDHLNGIIFVERMGFLRRRRVYKALNKEAT